MPLINHVVALRKFVRLFALKPREIHYVWSVWRSGRFDSAFYKGAYPNIHPWLRALPINHYVVYGEREGLCPNAGFSPKAYLKHNDDVSATDTAPFYHYVRRGHLEARIAHEIPEAEDIPFEMQSKPSFDPQRARARFAIVAHVYYADLWPEFEAVLKRLTIDFDLYVTLTYKGLETPDTATTIQASFPKANVTIVPNQGRDILPFFRLLNAGAFAGYDAVCKIHTKKSPHRQDGDDWRRHLIDGILPKDDLDTLLDCFLSDQDAAFWVADGQHYDDTRWWGSNEPLVRNLLQRLEIEIDGDHLSFPAGSMYWLKPNILRLLKAMRLGEDEFDRELGQLDGTVAHALERAMGFIASAADQTTRQTSELHARIGVARPERPTPPAYTSVFYLPQFHPVPENDAWWGKGFTEWRGTASARPMYHGHTQPILPTALGYYDLRVPEVMAEQAELARQAGINAFCVYHYWFDGRRILETPLDNLLDRPEIDFPFYLCWANESWRRNWDGLSGTVLLHQSYADGFEEALVKDSVPYMRDPRYQRPDGDRPRFVIYRPEDMPTPDQSIARMRQAWRDQGIGEVELGAVCFHIAGETAVSEDAFDFWIEMPPHGLVGEDDYLFGGPNGDLMERPIRPSFKGLVYAYDNVIENALDPSYVDSLPNNTICGVMPSWDNTARRGTAAHMAYGSNPARFGVWLDKAIQHRLPTSYRRELFVNAWNEWAEKAMLEPSDVYDDMYLQTLAERLKPSVQHFAVNLSKSPN